MSKNSHPDRGYLYERTEYDPLEKVLADAWETSYGEDRLELIIGRRATPSDRYVMASVVQWLGTNCGFSFLVSAFSKCGYTICGSMPMKRHFSHDDPLVEAIGTAQTKADWLAQVEQAGHDAQQLLFDLSEAN